MEFKSDNMTELYLKIIKELKNAPEIASRAGLTKELLNVSLVLKNPRSRFILDPLRGHSLGYLKKEFLWYVSQSPLVEDIRGASKFWETITDDGRTVNSNYGEKIFKKRNGWSQFDLVESELKKTPVSRRAVIMLMTPEVYGQMLTTKDFICNIFMQFYIRGGRLHQTVHTRSCDLVYGWSNDVPFFTTVQEMLAVLLGVPLGTYNQQITSLHIYGRHFKMLGSAGTGIRKFDKKAQIIFPRIQRKDAEFLRAWPEYERNWKEVLAKEGTPFFRFILNP